MKQFEPIDVPENFFEEPEQPKKAGIPAESFDFDSLPDWSETQSKRQAISTDEGDDKPGRSQTAASEFVSGAGQVLASLPKQIAITGADFRNQLSERAAKYATEEDNQVMRDLFGEKAEQLMQMEDPRELTGYKVGDAFDEFMTDLIDKNEDYKDDFWTSKVPNAFGQMTGFILSGGPVKAGAQKVTSSFAGRQVAPVTGRIGDAAATAVPGMTVGSVIGFEDALESGASLDEAFESSNWNAVVGASEGIPLANMLARADKMTGGGIKNGLKKALAAGTEEAIQESFSQIMQNLIASDVVKYDPDRKAWTGVDEGAQVGFTTGFLMQSLLSLVGGRRGSTDEQSQPEQATETESDAVDADTVFDASDEQPGTDDIDTAAEYQGENEDRINVVDEQQSAATRSGIPTVDDTDVVDIDQATESEIDAQETFADDNGLPESETQAEFIPTHEMPNGDLVQAVEDEPGVYVDKDGMEWEEPNAKPVEHKRTQTALRDAIDSMPADERDQVIADLRAENEEVKQRLYTSPVTGVPNRVAYDDAPKKTFTASVDVDSLKWINDNMGHPAGDELLKAVGEAMQEAGVEVYHVSGDEFIAQHDDDAELDTQLKHASELLGNIDIEVELPDGEIIKSTQAGFSYGIGRKISEAETGLRSNKSEREQQGLRSERGREPAGVVRATAEGNQNQADQAQQNPPELNQETVAPGTGKAGATDRVFTPDNKPVEVQYEVIEASDLVSSNDENGNINPAFPQVLQPRDRTGKKSQSQINKMASDINPERLGVTNSVTDGAPIIGDGNVVESGNGRVAAISKAYKGKGAGKYRKWLSENAEAFGLTADDLKGMKNPVLVRRRTTPMTEQERMQFAIDANKSTVANMSALEAAKTDATLINDDLMASYRPSEDGNILAESNSQFLRLFSQAIGSTDAAGLMSGDGRWTKQMADRVQAAVFHKAYGNDKLTELLAQEADPTIKNIINALIVAAPYFARIKSDAQAIGMDLPSVISDATAIVLQAKNSKVSVPDLVKQAGLFGDLDPKASMLAEFMDAYSRSAKRMGGMFIETAQHVEREIQSLASGDMFDRQPSTINDILSRAATTVEATNERQQQTTDLFTQRESPGVQPDNAGGRGESQSDGRGRAETALEADTGTGREQDQDQVASQPKFVGKNTDGVSLYENAKGVRYYVDNGIRVFEKVSLTPTRDGIKTSRPDRADGYKTVREIETEQAATQKESNAASPEFAQAQADLDAALGDLGEIFQSSNLLANKATPTELNASDLMPVLTRVMDAAFRMGYARFKDNARFVINTVRSRFGDAAADSIDVDSLQGAYIGMKKGSDTKLAVISVESIDEIMQEDVTAESGALADALFNNMDSITDNRQLKAAMAEYVGVKPSEVSAEQMKQAQEALELALVRKARGIVAEGGSVQDTYQSLLAMYQAQPNLNMRSSTSMENQAYSTPAPLAYLVANLADANADNSVYEPTAGNGMLLITSSPDNTIVNELNDVRASQLREQGFTVTQNDATTFAPTGQVDAVVMNPPFATIKATDYDGYKLKAIDHLITAKSLEAMKDDGKAAIIIGANKNAGDIKPAERTFFNWLYSNYNVADHFEVDGDLYRRQGAGWPVRVIVVNGRRQSKQISPKSGTIERIETWDQVYERYLESLDASRREPGNAESVDDETGNAVEGSGFIESAISDAGQNQGASDRRPGKRPANKGSSGADPRNDRTDTDGSGSSSNVEPDSNAGSRGDADQSSGLQQESADQSSSQQTAAGTKSANVGGGRANSTGRNVSKAQGSGFQTAYTTFSAGSNEAVLTPSNMAQATSKALSRIEQEVGSLDQYVMDKLGYDSMDALHDAFMGLQVDTVAAAIYNAEKDDKAIIIADQTGVGKGRQAAGIIRYALRQGKIPVFITVKPNLFTDMYNDLKDIGSDDVVPFIMNREEYIKSGKERLFTNGAPAKHKQNLREIIDTGMLPGDANALFLTYSQLNTPNIQRQVLDAIKGNAFFVTDEAHNAAGDRVRVKKGGVKQVTTAGFIYESIENSPVTYLSATYAKRPDNIPVYYRTDLMDAVDTIEELVDAVSSGGSALQTVMSGMLAEAGQLFRRERSFDGIEVITSIDTENTDEHTKFADTVTMGLRAITEADRSFHKVTVKGMQEAAQSVGGTAQGAGNRAASSIDHTNFTSIVHNFISQLLLGLKAKRAAELAINLHKQGIKPVIALENTMGSFLKQYVSETGAAIGDDVDADYRDILHRALDRTRRIQITNPKGEKILKDVPISSLDPYTRSLYKSAADIIDSLEISALPISPIDYVRSELEKAGISNAEITGREYRLDYTSETPTLAVRDSKEIKDRRATVDSFNNGELDALVLNAAGSTGLSIHASEKFTDQKPRHMIVMQAMADINILMQMLGRINRTGQVELPKYTMMGLDIPAEKRPLARTANKMKSLNANTSANTESDTSVKAPDIMNKYGDKVVNEYLKENPDVALRVDMGTSGEDNPLSGTAMKFTGRLALLPVKDQLEIYDQIETAYNDLIDYLNKTNQNDLEPRVMDLDAKIVSSEVLYEGKNPESIFGGNTYMHKVDAKYQGKPPTPEEVAKALDKVEDPKGQVKAIIDAKAADTSYAESLESSLKEANRDLLAANEKRASIEDTEENQSEIRKAEKQIDELGTQVTSLSNRIDDLELQKARTERMLNTFTVGNRVRLNLDDEVVNAVAVNVKDSHKAGKGNPYAPSKVRVSFMVNNGIRSIDLPFSRLDSTTGIFVEQLRTSGKEGLDSIFDMSDLLGDRRETRYIATGNLIAGSAELPHGRINSFSDSEGNTHLGIIMPKSHALAVAGGTAKSKAKMFVLRDPAVMTKFLRQLGQVEPGTIKNASEAITIYRQKDGKGWEIELPRANTQSSVRAVKFDDGLRAAMGTDFFGSGQTMSAKFPDSKLPKVLKELVGLTKMEADNSLRGAWTAAGGQEKAEAVNSFDARPQQDDAGIVTIPYTEVKDDQDQSVELPAAKRMDSSSVVTGDLKPKGISVEKAQNVADEIIASFRGNMPLDVWVARTQEEIYGPEATRENVGTIKGMYHPAKKVFTLTASNLSSAQDAREVARHEIVGHYGLNTFKPEDKRAILEEIINSRGHRSLAPVWQQVDELYGDLDDMGKAEEVFAFIAEKEPAGLRDFMDKLLAMLRKALKAVGLLKNGVISKSELRNLSLVIAKQIREGKRQQQTFPKSEMEQFNRGQRQINTPEFKEWFGYDWKNETERRNQGSDKPNPRTNTGAESATGRAGRSEILGDGRSTEADQRERARQAWNGGLDPETGEPRVWYHGTGDSFTQFDLNSPNRKDHGWLGTGVYLTSSNALAKGYAEIKSSSDAGKLRVMPLYSAVRNPYFATPDEKQRLRFGSRQDADRITAALKSNGHDGIVLALPDGSIELVTFDTTKVKSATDNRGTFDINDPDIRMRLDDDVKQQSKRLGQAIKDGAPIDKLFATAFGWAPKLTKPVYGRMADALTKWDTGGKFAGLDTLIKTARAGLIDRYGLDDEYKKRDMQRESQQNQIMQQGVDFLQSLASTDMSVEESRILQAVLTGEKVEGGEWNKIAEPIRLAIDDLGREAVILGLLDEGAYQKNRGSYLHRTYLKYEANQSTAVSMFSRGLNTFRKNINGNSLKGRGMDLKVDADKLRTFDRDWWGKTSDPAKFDEQLQGRKYIVLTRMVGRDVDTPTMAGIEEGSRQGKKRETIYWPADKAMPAKYLEWDNRGEFEVMGRKAGKVVLWRDFTKEERLKMGEILDARYNIAKTFHLMAHDLANGRFLKDIADNDAWAWRGEGEPDGVIASASEGGYAGYGAYDWVLVPETTIPKTNKKRWGALAGRYVRAEIWRDLNQQDQMMRSTVWRKALTQWKLNKTARNPVVHLNNVMSNLVFMDMADVRARDLVTAIQAIKDKSQDYEEAQNLGAFGGNYVGNEIQQDILQPILDELSKQAGSDKGTFESMLGTSGKFVDEIAKAVKKADNAMVGAYQMEDVIFRMATYMRRKEYGDSSEDAASYAREQFLNYDIRAPWVNALRNTVLPFISYTYRAVPVIAKSIAERPWKLAKYTTIAWAANALGYMMAPGDEDEERAAMPDTESGHTWLGVPRMIRMPFRDEHGNPTFLDVRRWIPAGDVFDMNQGHSALPIPSPIQFGGPLMLAFEFALNKQAFTGDKITDDYDLPSEKLEKVGAWAWRSWMPSAPWVYESWYWDKIGRSINGATDYYGRPYDLAYSALSSLGVKVKQHDVNVGRSRKMFELEQEARSMKAQRAQAERLHRRRMISDSHYQKEIDRTELKMKRIREKAMELR